MRHHSSRVWLVLLLALSAGAAVAEDLTKQDLFVANTDGYAIYRIPGIVVTAKGTLLAYCEARRSAKGDWGEIDVMLRRSNDGGRTWGAPRKIAAAPKDAAPNTVSKQNLEAKGATLNNPVAIADPAGGAVHFLYCVNYARCFYMRSDDDGVSFSDPVEITASAFGAFRKEYDWKVIATGSGHGIRLRTGRLVVPVWLSLGTESGGHHPSCVATIYSDDAGKNWRRGDIVADDSPDLPNPNESTVAELSDGRVMVNMRNESPRHRRAISISQEGFTGWSKPQYDETLIEPICFGSLVSVPAVGGGKPLLAWSNPVSDVADQAHARDRVNLTIRLSHDDGNTWPEARLLEQGVAGYSDLAASRNGAIYCFYERGGVDNKPFQTQALCLVRFTAAWVAAPDRPAHD
jgi:sialidase-1